MANGEFGMGSKFARNRGTRERANAQEDGSLPEVTFEAACRNDRVVYRLIDKGVITENDVRAAYGEWTIGRENGVRVPLWRMLTLATELDTETIYFEASKVYAFEEAEIEEKQVLKFLEEHRESFDEEAWDGMLELFLLPIALDTEPLSGETRWTFATHDPTRPEIHQLLKRMDVRRFEVRYCPEAELATLVTESFVSRNEYLERLENAQDFFDIGHQADVGEDLVTDQALEQEIKGSKLINLFEAALIEAVKIGTSDLHIFPNPDGKIEIHFRVDGELTMWYREETVRAEAFLAVVKDNAVNVDRFERDRAQDGFIQRWIDETLIRFRVSVLPIATARQEISAESIVIRVLDDRKVLTDLRKIGLLETAMKRFEMAIRQPNGMVILTGPTGSGKSTTLVAALHQVVTPKVNVLTVEDPVEYIIRGVRQIKLSHKLDLEGALRAILRHDPDIVMVGEMRDRQTAELAVKLANTGHLCFSTLHTNDAPSAVSRLFKMGVEPFLIAYAINLVVAQRLVRRLCPDCKRPDPAPDEDLLQFLGFPPEASESGAIYIPGSDPNCPVCKGVGYKGRRAIAEVLPFTPAIRKIVMESETMVDEEALKDTAVSEGMLTLPDSAKELVMLTDTSVEEMMRVTGAEL
ncbi:MAG: type II/IV secretion system protein [Rhodothermales bacterium]|nr:type II/IV secretion system protein [Rhodothermales bacterium]MBO6781261.1 type II/IV secretion system protein [Rhodothermales bacterium]